jgi:AcrR family transcriptional regulator
MKRWQRSEKRQIDIVNTAVGLFVQFSVRKTSMDDIAKAAKASKVTIYKYFTDKETLCRKVFEHISNRYLQSLNSPCDADASLPDRMIQTTLQAAGFISSGQRALCEELAGVSSSIAQGYSMLLQRQTQLIFQLIREGRQQSFIQSGPDDDIIFHYIDMGLCYYQTNSDYRHKIEYDARFRERFMAFVWRNVFEGGTPFNRRQ